MIRPQPLATEEPYGPWSCRGVDIWETLCAARDGAADRMEELLARDPNLHRCEYWYTQPIHFAVREGHLEVTRHLLEAGADPGWRRLGGDDLTTLARDRGHERLVTLLAAAERHSDRVSPSSGDAAAVLSDSEVETTHHRLHRAAELGDVARLRRLLGSTATEAGAGDEGPSSSPEDLHALDAAGRTPLSHAVRKGQIEAATLLLEAGADPNWPEGAEAPRGTSLYVAARAGNRRMVELLLRHGADPNAEIDASGSATWAAANRELRGVLIEHGGRLSPFDLVFLNEDEEAIRAVERSPESALAGCGGVLAAACTLGKAELLDRLLALGVHVPPVLTECRSYLWEDSALLRRLLESGMDPDLPDWLHSTPLHSVCERDSRGRARPQRVACAETLLEFGASIDARDEDYQSTPLGWAARCGLEDMVELLLSRGARPSLDDDPPWATPRAWAERRGHEAIARRLSAVAR